MVQVVVIDPLTELILHNVPIVSKDSVRWLKEFCRAEEEDWGRALVRLLICEGTVQVMTPLMEIPVPVYPAMRRS